MFIATQHGRTTDKKAVVVWVLLILLLFSGGAIPALIFTIHLPQRR